MLQGLLFSSTIPCPTRATDAHPEHPWGKRNPGDWARWHYCQLWRGDREGDSKLSLLKGSGLPQGLLLRCGSRHSVCGHGGCEMSRDPLTTYF